MADGPLFLVTLQDDDPWIEAVYARAPMTEAESEWDERRRRDEVLESTLFGTLLTRDELMMLPNGADLLAEFMEGDTRRRDAELGI
jgi:hypothetical protein